MTVLLDIIDRYSFIVNVNLKAMGITKFTGLTLPLQVYQFVIYLIKFGLRRHNIIKPNQQQNKCP